LTDSLSFSNEHNLTQLHKDTFEYLDKDFHDVIIGSLIEENDDLLHLLLIADKAVNQEIVGIDRSDDLSPFLLSVLNQIAIPSPLFVKLAAANKVIYYGAGSRGRMVNDLTMQFNGKRPDFIWDINANSVDSINGITASLPDFQSLQDDCVLIICIDNRETALSLHFTCDANGFSNVYDWKELQSVWLYCKYKDSKVLKENIK